MYKASFLSSVLQVFIWITWASKAKQAMMNIVPLNRATNSIMKPQNAPLNGTITHCGGIKIHFLCNARREIMGDDLNDNK